MHQMHDTTSVDRATNDSCSRFDHCNTIVRLSESGEGCVSSKRECDTATRQVVGGGVVNS